jgi:hypothetical protein
MGDRANVVVRREWPKDVHPQEAVFLYTHWGGEELPRTARAALKYGKSRWDDPDYLARIVFDFLTGREEGASGFGISTRLLSNENPLFVLDTDRARVVLLPERVYREAGFANLAEHPGIPFETYVTIPEEDLNWKALPEYAVPVG